MGNFKTLVTNVTINRGMLMYLDGAASYAVSATNPNGPNENYARELQELLTIGKDLPSYFTEGDNAKKLQKY
ncbi:MAG: DUF1800 family protein [Saprospiraceae bacterium]|nr:DUF1800 family protein [Saprospiraceae bacterium]